MSENLVKLVKEHVTPKVEDSVLETVFAGLNESDAKEFEDGLARVADEKAALTKEVADLKEKMAGMIEKPEEKVEIKMEDLPEPIRVRLEKADKMEAELAEERRVRILKEATDEAKTKYPSLVGVTPEQIAPVLIEAREKLTKESAAVLEDALAKTCAAMSESGMFKPVGSDAPDGGPNGKLEAAVTHLMKEDKALTIEQARTEAMRRDPSLYGG